MDNRINVEQVIQASRKKEQMWYIVIAVIGIVLPFALWVFYFNNLESANWRGFFTVVMVILMGFSLMYGATKLISVNVKEKKFRTALTKYASLIEKTQVPEVATVITCLHTGVGRFGFDAINYHFWKEGDEFVFYPVRPEYKTAKAYNLVEAVRLNTQMVRSFYVTGDQFFEVKPAPFKEVPDNDEQSDTPSKPVPPVYRDTRATIIAYAVGDQTVYLTFSLNLNDRLKELIPDKEKAVIEIAAKQALADSLMPIVGTPPVETAMDKIADLQLLRDNGTITEEEFQERKNKLLDQQ